jgi:putative tricarboxylic transport membrane protein
MDQAPKLRLATFFDLVLIVLGLVITYVSWQYGLGGLSRPGPGLYPFFIGVAISVFALFILISDLGAQPATPLFDKAGVRTLVFMTLSFCLWILAMPLLGYVVVTLLATYAFCKIMKLEGWRKPLAMSAGTAAFIYLLFDYWLYIDLPRGILG